MQARLSLCIRQSSTKCGVAVCNHIELRFLRANLNRKRAAKDLAAICHHPQSSTSSAPTTCKPYNMSIEDRIESMGLYLPEPVKVPAGVVIDFAWARVHGDRVFASGHGPQSPDGTVAGPFGRVGAEVTVEQAAEAAKLATLSLLASVRRALGGSLNRVEAVLRVDGFVLVAPGFDRTTNVINGCSRLFLELFGDDAGRHARTAMGVAATPLSCPVVIAAEFAIRSA